MASPATAEAAAPGVGGSAIGFLFVGPKDDFGYNQAAYLGSVAVEKAFSQFKVIRAENVPETAEAERVMEQMIRNGARIIFPTSYGHLDPALEVAKRHPEVVFLHLGGLKTAENLGTYAGNIWEASFLSGMTAGKVTKTNKLGYVIAFPIPIVLLNTNAFTRGARSVNPQATVTVVFTAAWCDPGKQVEAANTLIAQGVDVLGQNQDCTKAIVEAAERRGVMSVGYHADASALAPQGWVTGPIWRWDALNVKQVQDIVDGKWTTSPYKGRYRAGLKEGVVDLAPFGRSVPEEVRKLVLAQKQAIIEGSFAPFAGPVKDQSGNVRIPAGVSPAVTDLEKTDYLVEGVIGTIPR
jgi:basic membrane lipoprotein Med (substrate-binding protein (PBP1-ABC) superfamily)